METEEISFTLKDEDIVNLAHEKYLSKLSLNVQDILGTQNEEFLDLSNLINLINGLTTDPHSVMRGLLKIGIILKLLVKDMTFELEDKQIILDNQIGKLKFSYSLQEASNPYHGKLKITVESLNSLIDMNPSVTGLRRTLNDVKHKRDVLFALSDLVEKEIDICKSLLYTMTSNPELAQSKILSQDEIARFTQDFISQINAQNIR